jgi:ADP-dependent NAD(P)H-hydrate dehydratase / NAD(P)H-hydrate epimerase
MIEILTSDEMGEADRLTIAGGVPGLTLMENAGSAVAQAVAARQSAGSRVVVLAGPGNNGGDGFVAARVLAQHHYRMKILLVGDREKLTGDAAAAANRWNGPVAVATPDGLAGADIIVDALFGAGLDRPVNGLAREMIEAVNNQGAPVIAVDLPSGINGTSGAVMGAAIKAAQTVTFFRKKPGHLLMPGRIHCGAVSVAQIGIPETVLACIGPRTCENTPDLWREKFPRPRAEGHKYDRERVQSGIGEESHQLGRAIYRPHHNREVGRGVDRKRFARAGDSDKPCPSAKRASRRKSRGPSRPQWTRNDDRVPAIIFVPLRARPGKLFAP